MNFAKLIFKHVLIFMGYFMVSSLVLLNKMGGADILFFGLMIICFLVHLIVLIAGLFKNRSLDKQFCLLTVVALFVVFVVLVSDYLSFFWSIQ